MPDTIVAKGARNGSFDPGEWSGELNNLEQRAETDSLEGLQQRRRQILPEYSTLKSLHGSNGKWDARRKQMLEAIKVRVRMDLRRNDEKATEAMIDALAHADDQYAKLVDEGIAGATRYVELDIEVQEITEKIRAREIALMAYSAEVRLGR